MYIGVETVSSLYDEWKIVFTRQCVSALSGRRYTTRFEWNWHRVSHHQYHPWQCNAPWTGEPEQGFCYKEDRKRREDQIFEVCRGGIDSHSLRTLCSHIGMQLSTTAWWQHRKSLTTSLHLVRSAINIYKHICWRHGILVSNHKWNHINSCI